MTEAPQDQLRERTVVCISDLHGWLPLDIPHCDLLVIGGDVCPTSDHRIARQEAWIDGPFRQWLEQVPAETVVGTWGNHDFFAQDGTIPANLPGTWLHDEAAEWKGLKVWGSAWTPTFFNWAYMKDDQDLTAHWAMIPDDTSILITHGPPYGRCDLTARGVLAGSVSLEHRVRDLKQLQLHVCGHIHEGYGSTGNTINASHVNLDYRPVNQPVVKVLHV